MGTIHNLSNHNSIINHYVKELRSVQIQKDSMRFRTNLERVGQLMAYEISKTFTYTSESVETPLGQAQMHLCESSIVLASILRAGLPVHNGFLYIFDQAENGFISAYRQHHKDGNFDIKLEYITCPNLEAKTLILIDPMLATGASIHKTLEELSEYGTPNKIHVACVLAAQQGVNHIHRYFPQVNIWAAAIDEELTAKSYIVPGLGDAGDLAFGSKLQE